VGTFDGSTVHLYVDGLEVDSGSAAPGSLAYSLAGSNNLFIGDYAGCSGRTFAGEIDDARVWNTALTSTQVAALMPQPASDLPGPSGSPGSNPPTGGQSPAPTSDGRSIGDRSSDLALLAPRISKLAWSLRPGRQGHGGGAARETIRYRDTEPAHSTLTVERAEPGIRRQDRCIRRIVSRSRLHSHAASCRRWLRLRSFTHVDVIGENTIRAILSTGRTFVPGSYRLLVAPVLGQIKGHSVTVGFLARR
jgi:hypothetical protein